MAAWLLGKASKVDLQVPSHLRDRLLAAGNLMMITWSARLRTVRGPPCRMIDANITD
ncbi:hypothetical protein UVI_02004630 [Ustilaginoidea virens]|uniref:Uncharacterized protein n=1 Tax=Ustilaginoidea virens TaxID=1159556 RepID=A0A1B5KSG1_USTVR|nr:hypothetical protein UVI_02004630 [Ustilaginoidea virens]